MKILINKDCKIYGNHPRQLHIFKKDSVIEANDDFAERLIELDYGRDESEKDNNELESLKAEAKELKIKSSHVMGIDKLKEAILAKKDEDEKKGEKALTSLENKAITNINNK